MSNPNSQDLQVKAQVSEQKTEVTPATGSVILTEGVKYDQLLLKMENLQKDHEKTKASYIELLGLFAGIVSFILGTLHFITSQIPFSQALVSIITLGVTLAIFVMLIDRIAVRRMPKMEFYFFILVATLVLAGLVWFAFAYQDNWEKYIQSYTSATNTSLNK